MKEEPEEEEEVKECFLPPHFICFYQDDDDSLPSDLVRFVVFCRRQNRRMKTTEVEDNVA